MVKLSRALRRVIARAFVPRRAGELGRIGTVVLYLECFHRLTVPASRAPARGRRVSCPTCRFRQTIAGPHVTGR